MQFYCQKYIFYELFFNLFSVIIFACTNGGCTYSEADGSFSTQSGFWFCHTEMIFSDDNNLQYLLSIKNLYLYYTCKIKIKINSNLNNSKTMTLNQLRNVNLF